MRCVFCQPHQEEVLWRDAYCRVILTVEPDYPAFCRIVWNDHVREMTDLPATSRMHFMSVVFATEQALRELLHPEKVNLASLGNQVPHLHWHVIARFADDAHFPDAVWAARRRDGVRHEVGKGPLAARLAELLPAASFGFSRGE